MGLKISGRKQELIHRISTDQELLKRIGICIIEETHQDPEWKELYEKGFFDSLLLASLENVCSQYSMHHTQFFSSMLWASLSLPIQNRLITELLVMQEVPAGKFTMSENRYAREVTLTRPFLIGKYPVTQALWEMVMKRNGSTFSGATRPVENVNWFEALVFCNRLSELHGLQKVYTLPAGMEAHLNTNLESPACYIRFYHQYQVRSFVNEWSDQISQNIEASGYRLPSDAEWEFAAKSQKSFRFSGSTKFREAGWFKKNSQGKTHGVGQLKKNNFGLYDMSGNVWEWCWDWWTTALAKESRVDPFGPSEPTRVLDLVIQEKSRVMRGGAWNGHHLGCHLSSRNTSFTTSASPLVRVSYIGFRVVRRR